jgi:hypothetical protein
MEDTVLSVRIVTTSAVFLALAAANASAQTATADPPDKPLPLLQIFQQKDGTAVQPHRGARFVKRKFARTRLANRKPVAMHHAFMEVPPQPRPAQPATTTDATSIWPAPDVTLPGLEGLTPDPMAAASTNNEPIAPSATPAKPDEVQAAASHTVQVAPQVTTPTSAQATTPSIVKIAQADAVSTTDVAVDLSHDADNSARPNDPVATVPVQHTMRATTELQNPNPVGSTTWIAHVLAALGGAIAAGTIAWWLISPMPSRSYP